MKIAKNITKVNFSRGSSARKYIVIHYTGNRTDTPEANANYFKSSNRGASAHYFVGTSSIVQVVADSNTAWAVGRNYGGGKLYGKCTNYNSISIEMCSRNGKIPDSTIKNTVYLTKLLMKKYGIPASRVVRHYDVCGKRCPGWSGWLPGNESEWKKFKKAISSKEASTASTGAKSTGYYRKYTGTSGHIDVVFKAVGVPVKYRGSVAKRKAVAKKNGYASYTGTSVQNLGLIALAKKGKLKKV